MFKKVIKRMESLVKKAYVGSVPEGPGQTDRQAEETEVCREITDLWCAGGMCDSFVQ